jgi:hypothetical protein
MAVMSEEGKFIINVNGRDKSSVHHDFSNDVHVDDTACIPSEY